MYKTSAKKVLGGENTTGNIYAEEKLPHGRLPVSRPSNCKSTSCNSLRTSYLKFVPVLFLPTLLFAMPFDSVVEIRGESNVSTVSSSKQLGDAASVVSSNLSSTAVVGSVVRERMLSESIYGSSSSDSLCVCDCVYIESGKIREVDYFRKESGSTCSSIEGLACVGSHLGVRYRGQVAVCERGADRDSAVAKFAGDSMSGAAISR